MCVLCTCVRVCVHVYVHVYVCMGACTGVYACLCVGCGCASVVPGEGCTYMCVCALHLLCVVGVTYMSIVDVRVLSMHMRVCHTSVQRCCVCTCESVCAYVQYVVLVFVYKLLCLHTSYCVWVHMFKTVSAWVCVAHVCATKYVCVCCT